MVAIQYDQRAQSDDMDASVELHDSDLAEIRADGSAIDLVLTPAYVHRWNSENGRRVGRGLVQTARLRIQNATTSFARPLALPCTITDGELRASGCAHENLLPAPLEASGRVRLRLELSDGNELIVDGDGITLALEGEPVFVEDLPPDLDDLV